MDMLSTMKKMNAIGKYPVLAFIALNLLSLSFATTGLSVALVGLCRLSQQFLGIAVMLMIVLAGAIYALGQMLGAETRARASVWATAMLTGAVIGIIIYILAPAIVGLLLGGANMPGADPCTFSIAGG